MSLSWAFVECLFENSQCDPEQNRTEAHENKAKITPDNRKWRRESWREMLEKGEAR